ncbi:probable Mig1 protein, induced during biotrophic phase [Sporisorium reilianum f. sp. reilianum]|uniref:Probable Mig1 protein, induced during biotrophic phase n=1 Tax=Sporisorium reilianum f. sp. reilianum TaxID=72559 RepID=A0A2N8UEQ2_9BASI|nr:probable Mig1 protein, induced during biotrophic phase [Sporisorium reilianum f. sp. reilianum]
MLFKAQALAPVLLLLPWASALFSSHPQMVGGWHNGCKAYTKLLPRYEDYRKHCEAEAGPSGSDKKWPCFTMWFDSLKEANATVGDGKIAPDNFFLVKDGYKTDFTIKDPKQPFVLTWDYGTVSMTYSDHDDKSGCYKIQLQHHNDNRMRIWVSDEDGDNRDLDTLHAGTDPTATTLCSKWLHLHVKNDSEDD